MRSWRYREGYLEGNQEGNQEGNWMRQEVAAVASIVPTTMYC